MPTRRGQLLSPHQLFSRPISLRKEGGVGISAEAQDEEEPVSHGTWVVENGGTRKRWENGAGECGEHVASRIRMPELAS